MSTYAPANARCGTHPEVAAAWCCGRCGNFFCVQCEKRVRPDAQPMCPACWELRGQKVAVVNATSGTGLQTAGLVLGLISLFPHPALQIASIIVNIIAIVRAKEPPAREVRWRPIVGLCATGVGFVGEAVMFAVAFSQH